MVTRTLTVGPTLLVLIACSGQSATPADNLAAPTELDGNESGVDFFEREVRPLLARRCHKCHGDQKQESSLRLDSRAGVLSGGEKGKVIAPGLPDQSRLIKAIRYNGDLRMPPDGKLPDGEIEVLTRWVQLGAPWPASAGDASGAIEPFDFEKRRREHWAWQPVRDPPLPDVLRSDWPRDPLDRFILARLEAVAIEPAPEANRRTWLRRVTFDLTGLPPTPEEIDAFLADQSAAAYETVVDRLLASPHCGERWARHWMDLVRYAETYGHEFDYSIPDAWRYRDYLIRAFNADVPYDQLVKEHIAGDLLPQPRRHPDDAFNESIIGTGFWWLGEATHAPTDVRGDEAGRIDNQIDVFTKTFLGLTIACARCHDHKFDAISTKDYYALAGFLQSSRRQSATLDTNRGQERLAEQAGDIQKRGTDLLDESMRRFESEDEVAQRFQQLLRAAIEAGPPPAEGGESAEAREYDDRVESAGASHGVDDHLVRAWADAVYSEELQTVSHPLIILGHVARSRPASSEIASTNASESVFSRVIAEATEKLHAARDAWDSYERETKLFASFENGSFDGWTPSGWAFGDSPTAGGVWQVASDSPSIATGGVADSGHYHRRLHGALRSPTFVLDHDTIHYRVRGKDAKIRLVLDGYFMARYSALLFGDFEMDVDSPDHFSWQVQAGDVHRYKGHRAYIEVEDAGDGFVALDEVRFSNRRRKPRNRPSPLALALAASLADASLDAIFAQHAAALATAVRCWERPLTTEDDRDLVEWMVSNSLILPESESDDEAMTAQWAALLAEFHQAAGALPRPMQGVAMTDGSAENERVHVRGSHRTLGEVVPRRLPEALGGDAPTDDEKGSGRLLLAERVASADNPLTARVMVNRIWHHLTGRGIVASVDNFGAMGTPPTHPELLDHLATRFTSGGWSIKGLIRAILLSSTYRMASTYTESGQRIDPANHLLHAMRIRRLEGEAIRDAILAVSGRLDPTLYGPSVNVHLTPFMQGRGRPGESGPLDGDGRRSLYITVRRNFLSPMMLAFDTPIPFTTIGRRNTSNVPAQALILMNDPFVAGEARRWAENLLAQPHSSPAHRLHWMYRQALGRPPTSEETQAALSFLERQAEAYGTDPAAWQADVRVWADLCHVVLNLKEFILIY